MFSRCDAQYHNPNMNVREIFESPFPPPPSSPESPHEGETVELSPFQVQMVPPHNCTTIRSGRPPTTSKYSAIIDLCLSETMILVSQAPSPFRLSSDSSGRALELQTSRSSQPCHRSPSYGDYDTCQGTGMSCRARSWFSALQSTFRGLVLISMRHSKLWPGRKLLLPQFWKPNFVREARRIVLQ
jgi:hypothetical protein